MSSLEKITLKSSDGEAFEVDKAVALMSQTIADFVALMSQTIAEAMALKSQTIKPAIEDTCADNGIPLPNVTSKILAKVIEYCKNHVEELKTKDLTSEDDLKRRDTEFVKVDQTTLYGLIMAADYLNIKSLLDLTCQFAVDMIKGKTPEEIHESQMLKHMIELIKYYSVDKKLYLPSFSSKMLAKVIDYRKKHVEALNPKDCTSKNDLKNWDTEFVKVDQATLFDLILAAKFWNIESLLDLTCQTVADMIKGKTPAEIRKTFNIKEDFHPEQEEEVRRENQWAFE